jgi:hypothetical protein
MNYTFNTNRFGKLFLKHTREHYKGYLLSIAVLVGVMILGGSFLIYMVNVPIDKNAQTFLFMVLLLLAGTVFTSTIFTDLGDKKSAMPWLTLPASHFEKYLVAWIYSFLVFLVIYTVIFYLSVLSAINIKRFPNYQPDLLNVFEPQILQMYLVFALLHSISFFGAIYFEKLHFIKTAVAFFISMALLILINKLILGALLGRAVEATPPFGNLLIADKGPTIDIHIIEKMQYPYMLCLIVALAIIFWVGAYYRLKEKQV